MFCCGMSETIDNSFISCTMASAIWNWMVAFKNFNLEGLFRRFVTVDSYISLKDVFLVDLLEELYYGFIVREK